MPLENPAAVMAPFRNDALDVTFIGITARRGQALRSNRDRPETTCLELANLP
jgi:hypothetical protein